MSADRTQELLSAIHRHCLTCSGGSRKEAERCKVTQCELFPYRAGLPKAKNETTIDGQTDLFAVLDEEALS